VGIDADSPRLLKDANNTLVLLPAANVVAKVATSTVTRLGDESLARELRVASHLAGQGAPVVHPLSEGAAGPHESDGLVLTFWEYCEPDAAQAEEGAAVGYALREMHDALATYAAEALPALETKIARAAALYAAPEETPGLEPRDRQVAAAVYGRLLPALRLPTDRQPLHGEPHTGNVVWHGGRPLFLDFEAVCIGPREWDLAYMSGPALEAFREFDEQLLDAMHLAVSFCVTAWCSAQPGRAPEVDEAARYHLEVLRRNG
jgi:Ser/Thr protein kinase RdoA (MazF antagonist)